MENIEYRILIKGIESKLNECKQYLIKDVKQCQYVAIDTKLKKIYRNDLYLLGAIEYLTDLYLQYVDINIHDFKGMTSEQLKNRYYNYLDKQTRQIL